MYLKWKFVTLNGGRSGFGPKFYFDKKPFQIFATLAGANAVEDSIIVMEFVGLSSLQNVIEEHPHLLTSSFIHRFNSFFSRKVDKKVAKFSKLFFANL